MKSHNPKLSVYVYLHPTITQPESHVFVMFTLTNPYYKWRPTESLISLENKLLPKRIMCTHQHVLQCISYALKYSSEHVSNFI